MNKKTLLSISALAMTALFAVGGTLAWFTDKAEATNVFTTGNVNIKLEETQPDGQKGESGVDYGATMVSGDKINKDPLITNIGKNDAYVRALVEYKVTPPSGVTAPAEVTDFDKFMLKTGIELGDGWSKGTNTVTIGEGTAAKTYIAFYYNTKLEPNVAATQLFKDLKAEGATNSYTINLTELGNAYANLKFDINVVAEAVQADNMTFDATNPEATWSGIVTEKYTPVNDTGSGSTAE